MGGLHHFKIHFKVLGVLGPLDNKTLFSIHCVTGLAC